MAGEMQVFALAQVELFTDCRTDRYHCTLCCWDIWNRFPNDEAPNQEDERGKDILIIKPPYTQSFQVFLSSEHARK